jgi:hypothetical protein
VSNLIVCIHRDDEFIRLLDVNDPEFLASDDFTQFVKKFVELFSFFAKEFFNIRDENKGRLAPLPKADCMFPFFKRTGGQNWLHGAFYLKIMYEHNYLCIISRSIQGQHSQMAVEQYAQTYCLDLAQNGVMVNFAKEAIYGPRIDDGIWKCEVTYGSA